MLITKKKITESNLSNASPRGKSIILKKRHLTDKSSTYSKAGGIAQAPSKAVVAEVIEVTKSGIVVAVGENQVTYSFRAGKIVNYAGESFLEAGIRQGASVRIVKKNGEVLRASVLKAQG